jgi:hypothetical protein
VAFVFITSNTLRFLENLFVGVIKTGYLVEEFLFYRNSPFLSVPAFGDSESSKTEHRKARGIGPLLPERIRVLWLLFDLVAARVLSSRYASGSVL